DDQIVIQAAEEAGVAPEVIDQAEREEPDLRPILSAIEAWHRDEDWTPALDGPEATSQYSGLIRRVIDETALRGDVVIVAHGAGMQLAGRPGVLRVLITGSTEGRTRRLADRSLISDAEARREVVESDRQREAFFRRFYDINAELPSHYDLVIG